MRTRFCLLAVLAVLAVGLTVWAHGTLYAQREAVTAEQEVLQGDAAVVEGVSLEMRSSMDRHLFWETRITAGPEITCDTDYTFSRAERRSSFFTPLPTTGLRVDVMGDAGITGDWETEDQNGMQRPFNDVASRCPAGTEDYTETVRLRDYYEVYPLYVQNDFYDLLPAFSEEDVFIIEGEFDSPESQIQELLRKYFPIPVPEDAAMEVRIDKDAYGEIRSYGFDSLWPFRVWSVVREGGVYFIFSSREDADPLDTSLFPLGYGVYFLPVELAPAQTPDGQDGSSIRIGDPVRVCPVDPAVENVYLCGGEEGEMYLFTQREEALDMTVLDDGGAPIQTLRVLEGGPEDPGEMRRWLDTVWIREGYLVAVTVDDRFRVVETDGTCRATLEGSLRPMWNTGSNVGLLNESSLDYDGACLAVVGAIPQERTACCLALYGEEGLAYLGIYTLNLSQEADCQLEDEDPLTVRLPR